MLKYEHYSEVPRGDLFHAISLMKRKFLITQLSELEAQGGPFPVDAIRALARRSEADPPSIFHKSRWANGGVPGGVLPAARFRTIPVVGACYPPEVPVAQALLGEHLIPAAAQVRQIGVAVWRLRRGLGVGRRVAGQQRPPTLLGCRHTATPWVVGAATTD